MASDEHIPEAREFWKELYPNIDIAPEIMNELQDYFFIMRQVPKVYCHVTGGRMSKINYFAEAVISEADEHQSNEIDECLKDEYEMLCAALDIEIGIYTDNGTVPKDYDYNDLRQLIIDHHG